MPAKQLTTSPTEADLEASIHHAVARAFPWLAPGSIRHQTKFAFSFGRKKIEVDGSEVSRAESRSDRPTKVPYEAGAAAAAAAAATDAAEPGSSMSRFSDLMRAALP